MGCVVSARGVWKEVARGGGPLTVLRGCSLDAGPGVTAMVGRSGAGKTSLLHIMSGLDAPTRGAVVVDGQDLGALNEARRTRFMRERIGFVFQSFNLLPKLTALDNVALPMVYAGVSKQERKERASQLLTELGLGTRLDHMPAELSGGQRQRVAIARALANDPAIIMADEPTGNLDSKASLDVMHIFTELYEQGRTIILVTHEPDIAEYAGRNVVLRDGLIVEDRQNFHMKGLQGGERHV